MISGAHVIVYSTDAEADRAFIRDVLKFPSVDAGRGWLIFALPPAEVAVHPAEGASKDPHALPTELYLMCEDVEAEVKRLEAQKVRCSAIAKRPWGLLTTISLPSGAHLGMYQPTHPTAIGRGTAV